MKLEKLFLAGVLILAVTACKNKNELFILDMVHHNPGEPMTESAFLDPSFLKEGGYNGKVFFLFEAAQFGIDWHSLDPQLFGESPQTAGWIESKKQIITAKYNDAKREGLKVYCMLDMLVLPKALVDKYRSEVTNESGKIDIHKPRTQEFVRILANEMFETFPQLDGLIIRTGETYLNDAPYHVGNHPVQKEMKDHIILINILREEVCAKRSKDIFYRTWDFGQLHSLPQHYLSVTDEVEPHEHLYFSIKHTITDFWRMGIPDPNIDYGKFNRFWINESGEYGLPFNPCIGIGKHKQIVEVQCQREYEGKAAHPNYIARGVINGFDEFQVPGIKQPFCLNQLKDNPLFKGIWTWSRGGGWGGPYIPNEFWTELNSYVVAQWANDMARPEKELAIEFAVKKKGLSSEQGEEFYRLCRLSETGVMKGQYSMMGGSCVLWTRDDNVVGETPMIPYFDKMIADGTVDAYIKEKNEAAEIWREIEKIAMSLKFTDEATGHFVRTSSTYGRIKYELFAIAWNIMLPGYASRKTGVAYDKEKMTEYIARYDRLVAEWQKLAADNDDCPSLYRLSAGSVGNPSTIDETIAMYRKK